MMPNSSFPYVGNGQTKGYTFASDSDCEILLPMFEEYGTDMFVMLDAEYACILLTADGSGEQISQRSVGVQPLPDTFHQAFPDAFCSGCDIIRKMILHVCQIPAIRETTDIRVLLTGEISDELFGYKYTDFAPDAEAFQAEAKLLRARAEGSSTSQPAQDRLGIQKSATMPLWPG